MKILFWNTHKNQSINSVLEDLILENNVSIVVLAEYTANMENLINNLANKEVFMKKYSAPGCERVKIIGNYDGVVEPGPQTDYGSIQIINNKLILCCVHLNSKLHSGHERRREIIIDDLVTKVKNTEERLKTDYSIIVGDFNINPYESACIDASYFHGIPFYEEAKRKTRIIAQKEFSMFYNPMWNFLGDSNKPYGTYYYNNSETENTYWNIFDQVIIRPSLKEYFVDENLNIITETKTKYLTDSNGHPDRQISDHLPIIFEIKENYNGKQIEFE